ncbi:MAG TPA: hypothetical protein VFZ65_08930 [Planctomycetota bacterium]|nr:hypothetical protein [Planctomycetota bacterium]
MTRLRNVLLVLAALFATAPVSAHSTIVPNPEPATPTGTYNVTPVPQGVTVTLVIVPAPFCGPYGPWFGYVFVNGKLVPAENLVLMRNPTGDGYLWENGKVGPSTGLPGAGTILWDNDHYESVVTQGDNAGARRTLTPT